MAFFLEPEDIKVFALKCIGSIISLLRVSEYKTLLDPKTLICLSQASLNPDYQQPLISILLKDIYERSRLLPPLLSILGLLLLSNESTKIKEALLQVFKNMKANSKEQQNEEIKLKLQPETYTPYLFFVIAKCNLQMKACSKVLSGYLKCLSLCDKNIDINYLIYLSNQLQKMSVTGKNIISDIFQTSGTGLELERICNEFSLILVENYIPADYAQTSTKLLIPSAYFIKIKEARLSTPVELKKKLDGTPALKRNPEDSPKQKKFKIE